MRPATSSLSATTQQISAFDHLACHHESTPSRLTSPHQQGKLPQGWRGRIILKPHRLGALEPVAQPSRGVITAVLSERQIGFLAAYADAGSAAVFSIILRQHDANGFIPRRVHGIIPSCCPDWRWPVPGPSLATQIPRIGLLFGSRPSSAAGQWEPSIRAEDPMLERDIRAPRCWLTSTAQRAQRIRAFFARHAPPAAQSSPTYSPSTISAKARVRHISRWNFSASISGNHQRAR